MAILAAQETACHRRIGYETDTVLSAEGNHVGLPLAFHDGIFALHGGNWCNGMSCFELFERRLGLSPCTDFAFPYQFAHPIGHFCEVAFFWYAMFRIKVDVVGL